MLVISKDSAFGHMQRYKDADGTVVLARKIGAAFQFEGKKFVAESWIIQAENGGIEAAMTDEAFTAKYTHA